ncbi:MAG TPA: HPr-rel-A system PqqD family peptide chaperone [Stellaceae bacterium]|nr:HPr-rel-A system PqqD family peptide chaperone [Stellaceae bacterium]
MPDAIWRTNHFCSFRWRRWGDEWVVFDEGSGDTYHLDGLSAVALMCLAAGPCSLAELSQQVSIETDLAESEELSRALVSVIDRFSGLDLIEAATP